MEAESGGGGMVDEEVELKKISGNMTSVLSLVRLARRVAIAKSDYFICSQPDGLCIMQKCETRRG